MNEQDYICPQCKRSWWIKPGCYTQQSMISKAKSGDPDAYVETKEYEDGNKTVTHYLRKEGHCFCRYPFRPSTTKESIFEYFKRKGIKV